MVSVYRRLKRFFLSIILIIVFWGFVEYVFSIPNYLVPSPLEVVREVGSRHAYYIEHTTSTIIASLIGLLIALILGAIASILSVLYDRISSFLETGAVILRSLPIIAIAPLITVWFGSGLLSRCVIAALISFFPIFSSFREGMLRVERSTEILMRLYNATDIQALTVVRIPSSVPYIVLSLPLASTLAVLGALVAEFLGSSNGLGMVILRSLFRIDTPTLYAAICISSTLGVIAYIVSSLIEIPLSAYVVNNNTKT